LEVLVAVVISATAIMTLLALSGAALRQIEQTRDRRIAWELAAEAMGQILTEEAEQWGDAGTGTTEWPFPERLRGTPADGFRVFYAATVEEIVVSDHPDAKPERLFRVQVQVEPPERDASDPEDEPIVLITHRNFESRR
jgi:DMSO/TMAO reductase YedYZ molybdopterin-dependent catalytic subunit